MSATTPEKKAPLSLAYYVHSLVCLCIMFGFGLLDPVEPLTPLGMRLVGVFLGVLYGWVFIEIVWPSLAGLLAMMLVGGMKPVTLLNNSFGHPIVQMMFFIFVFCATINHYGLSRFISLWFITRKFVAGRPWLFSFTFLASIFILGALTSAAPAALIGWSIPVRRVRGLRLQEGRQLSDHDGLRHRLRRPDRPVHDPLQAGGPDRVQCL